MRVPDRTDIVWVDLDPTKGHEQAGKRPVLVLTSREYNQSSGLMLVCAITSRVKGYPFEIQIECGRIKGAVLADAIRSVSWPDRMFKHEGRWDEDSTERVCKYVSRLISP